MFVNRISIANIVIYFTYEYFYLIFILFIVYNLVLLFV